MRTCGCYPVKVLCCQEVVSPHLCGVVPCQVAAKASAPPGYLVGPRLVTPERRSGGLAWSQSLDFYALSCDPFRKQARNLIETAQRKSQEHLFADIFARDNLDYQSRELATIAALASMPGTAGQLRFHLGAAMHTGLTEAQMKDFIAVLQAKVGTKEAESAHEILSEVLRTRAK